MENKNEIIYSILSKALDEIFEKVGTLSYGELKETLSEVWVDDTYTDEDLKKEVEYRIEQLNGMIEMGEIALNNPSRSAFRSSIEGSINEHKMELTELTKAIQEGTYEEYGRELACIYL